MAHSARFRLSRFLRSLRQDEAGNILFMTVCGMLMLLFALGFVVDFSRAETVQTQLNAIADAAALAAVDPAMIYADDTTAANAATNLFNAQASQMANVTSLALAPVVPVDNPGLGGLRTVTITYTAQSTNLFGNFLGLSSLAISGSSTASASQPPNINFYVMVDNSPSMLIPADTADITSLQATTNTSDGGCAFTCHNREPQTSYNYKVINNALGSTNNYVVWIPDSPYTSSGVTGSQAYMLVNPSNNSKVYDTGNNLLSGYTVCPGSDSTTATSVSMATSGNNCSKTTISGQWADGYWVVEHYSTLYPGKSNITLRIDDASNALQQLVPYAYNTSQTNNATYAMQMLFFNNIVPDQANIYPSLPSGVSYLVNSSTGATSPVAKMTAMTTLSTATSLTVPTIPVPRWVNSTCVTNTTCPNGGTGAMTDFHQMFAEMQSLIPVAGTGTKGGKPQEVLLLITDGYDDDFGSGNRSKLTATELTQCQTLKSTTNGNPGVKIAILYTQYTPSSVSAIYPGYASVLGPPDQVAQALQSCASTNASGVPLFYEVTPGQSITPALQQLFASVVQSAYLAQ
jgi:Flp pilus assembly protein TadG